MSAPFATVVVDGNAPTVVEWAARLARSAKASLTRVAVESDETMPSTLAGEVERTGADLVVIARREPSSAPWLRLDGVLHQIIERSRVPLAVVPESWRGEEVPSRVGVGMDGSPRSQVAAGWAAAFAGSVGALVWVVHAADVGPALAGAGDPGAGYDATLRDRRAIADQEWASPLRAAGVTYETVVEDGPPVGLLFESTKKYALDLLVVGARGADEDAVARLGSVAHRVAGLAPCPCVIVPPRFNRT